MQRVLRGLERREGGTAEKLRKARRDHRHKPDDRWRGEKLPKGSKRETENRRGDVIKGVYKLTVSGIDGNGYQYISGMLEPERLDSNGFRVGKAFSVDIYHSKNESSLWTFQWVGGAPRNWTHIKTFRDEIIGENEVPALLKKYGLISEEDTL